MNKIFLAILCFLPLTAKCEVVAEVLCFSLPEKQSVSFELRTYFDSASKWAGAFVKYSKSNKPISLVVKDVQSEEIDPQSPEQTTTTWVEVSEGKVTGEYEMISQGASVLSMVYTKNSNGKKFAFENDVNIESTLESGCKW